MAEESKGHAFLQWRIMLDLRDAEQGLSEQELVESRGVTLDRLRKSLEELEQLEVVRLDPEGIWHLTDQGRKQVSTTSARDLDRIEAGVSAAYDRMKPAMPAIEAASEAIRRSGILNNTELQKSIQRMTAMPGIFDALEAINKQAASIARPDAFNQAEAVSKALGAALPAAYLQDMNLATKRATELAAGQASQLGDVFQASRLIDRMLAQSGLRDLQLGKGQIDALMQALGSASGLDTEIARFATVYAPQFSKVFNATALEQQRLAADAVLGLKFAKPLILETLSNLDLSSLVDLPSLAEIAGRYGDEFERLLEEELESAKIVEVPGAEEAVIVATGRSNEPVPTIRIGHFWKVVSNSATLERILEALDLGDLPVEPFTVLILLLMALSKVGRRLPDLGQDQADGDGAGEDEAT